MLSSAVLLPGLHGTANLFAGLLGCVAGPLELSTLELPSSGPQDYAALQAAIQPRLPAGDEPYALVAESFSGPLAIRIAASDPRGLAAVVLVNSFVASPVGVGLGAAAAFSLPLLSGLGGLGGLGGRGAAPKLIRELMLGRDAPDALVARVRDAIGLLPRATLAARLRTVTRANETAAYLRTQVPLFYLRSEQDRLVPEQALDRLIRTRPGLQVHRTPGPHLLLQRHPERAMELLQRCLTDRG